MLFYVFASIKFHFYPVYGIQKILANSKKSRQILKPNFPRKYSRKLLSSTWIQLDPNRSLYNQWWKKVLAPQALNSRHESRLQNKSVIFCAPVIRAAVRAKQKRGGCTRVEKMKIVTRRWIFTSRTCGGRTFCGGSEKMDQTLHAFISSAVHLLACWVTPLMVTCPIHFTDNSPFRLVNYGL